MTWLVQVNIFPTEGIADTWVYAAILLCLGHSQLLRDQERQPDHLVIIDSVTSDVILLIFFRWRLQKAFFTPQSVGSHGCRGISCKDFFPIFSCFSCCRTKHDPDTHPLKMSDLRDVKPQYVSNVAVDYWRFNSSSQSAPPFAVMSMSPHENQRIDQPGHTVNLAPDSNSPIDCQPGNNVSQVDAMVTSAAVMAISPEQNEPYRDLQIMLGLILRKGFKPTPYQESSPCGQCFSGVGWDEIFFIKLWQRQFRSLQASDLPILSAVTSG